MHFVVLPELIADFDRLICLIRNDGKLHISFIFVSVASASVPIIFTIILLYFLSVSGGYSFSIDDTRSFDEYVSGGVVTLVKQPQTLNFVSRLSAFFFRPRFDRVRHGYVSEITFFQREKK